eukprot:CAMPEP_0181255928 /NCGR_PEP_ID=MMETSP1096-20121128/49431_1 /TAXON_ID=156174 ORGANISM="Chrysochromulina ericina, Strain CCMP281" /NCGR_SAMPLE_ID=MMETSP1096 /ASSEMBLY_ACC=CAM_ASM_000453 /LENGTH=404 /DNA_ID=CAMNT_0023354129 /DNA_START=362 /DNA_END=1580 /DNA_ORIENTATION=-
MRPDVPSEARARVTARRAIATKRKGEQASGGEQASAAYGLGSPQPSCVDPWLVVWRSCGVWAGHRRPCPGHVRLKVDLPPNPTLDAWALGGPHGLPMRDMLIATATRAETGGGDVGPSRCSLEGQIHISMKLSFMYLRADLRPPDCSSLLPWGQPSPPLAQAYQPVARAYQPAPSWAPPSEHSAGARRPGPVLAAEQRRAWARARARARVRRQQGRGVEPLPGMAAGSDAASPLADEATASKRRRTSLGAESVAVIARASEEGLTRQLVEAAEECEGLVQSKHEAMDQLKRDMDEVLLQDITPALQRWAAHLTELDAQLETAKADYDERVGVADRLRTGFKTQEETRSKRALVEEQQRQVAESQARLREAEKQLQASEEAERQLKLWLEEACLPYAPTIQGEDS